jgi:glutamate-1-semialdehyde 2,1-aminomutase
MDRFGVVGCVQRVGAMLSFFPGPEKVASWDDAAKVDRGRFAAFFSAAYRGGVLLPPSPFEAWFLNDAHNATVGRAGDVLTAAVEAAV